MIRNEAEYQEASARLADERRRLAEHRARLKEAGLGEEDIKRVIDPMESFHLQLKEEVESYERLKRGEFEELENFRGFGHLLISLRIAKGMSQRVQFAATIAHGPELLILDEPFSGLDPVSARDLQELSNADVAATLGLSVAAVKSRLHRARIVLRDRLSRYFADKLTRKDRRRG